MKVHHFGGCPRTQALLSQTTCFAFNYQIIHCFVLHLNVKQLRGKNFCFLKLGIVYLCFWVLKFREEILVVLRQNSQPNSECFESLTHPGFHGMGPGRKHGTLGNLGTLGTLRNHKFRGFRDFLEFCVFEQIQAILENTEMLKMYGNSVIKAVPM